MTHAILCLRNDEYSERYVVNDRGEIPWFGTYTEAYTVSQKSESIKRAIACEIPLAAAQAFHGERLVRYKPGMRLCDPKELNTERGAG